MKKTIKAALKGITTATAGFLKKRGIYVVALALISAAALSAVLTVKQPNGADPAQTADPASEVNTDIGDRLNQAQPARARRGDMGLCGKRAYLFPHA